MNKWQKLVALAGAFVLMVGLSACGLNGQDVPSDQVAEFVLTLDDGTKVPCIKHEHYRGIDCNWNRATRPTPVPTPVKP